MTLAPGTKLGAYEILGQIGAGGMGEVYRARDTKLGRDVAIKVLPEEFFEDEERRLRFEREARALASLNHPGIAAIHSFEEVPGSSPSSTRHLLVMELVEGEDLAQRIASGPLSLEESLPVAKQIAEALEAAHEKGIVHRDLKPANVKVTPDGRVKLLDFGLAKIFEADPTLSSPSATRSPTLTARATAAGVILGSAAYMSPEQARGKTVDKRTDVWAFGCVLYEMLAGKRAFEGETVTDTLAAVLMKEPDWSALPAGTPEKIREILRKCLRRDAKLRLRDIGDARLDLDELASAGATSSSIGPLPFEENATAPGPTGGRSASAASARGSRKSLYLSWAIAAAAVAGAVWLSQRQKVSLPDFTRLTYRLGNVDSARFSPDGNTVVFSASWEGRPMEVFTAASDGSNLRDLGNAGAVVSSVSSRGEVALLVGNQQWRTRRGSGMTLAVLSLNGGAARELMENVRLADWGPDGSEMAVIHRIGEKDVLEYPIGTKLYESSAWLVSASVSRDGKRVAVFESTAESSTLMAIDRKGGKQVFSSGLRRGTPGLAWSPDDREIWVSHTVGPDPLRKTWAFDARGKVRLLFGDPSLTSLMDVSRDGRALFVRDVHRIVARFKAPGEAAERDVSWRDATRVADLSGDGTTLVFGEGDLATVTSAGVEAWITSTDGGLPKKLGDVAPGQLSADGRWVWGATTDLPTKGVLVPTGAGQPRVLETPGLSAHITAGVVLPGGEQVIAYAREAGQPPKTYVVDVATGRHRALAAARGVVSADGAQFAFRDAGNLVVVPVASGAPRVAGKLLENEVPLRWSRDGKSVYLRRGGPSDLALDIDRLDLDTGRRTPWKHLSLSAFAGASGFAGIVIAPEANAYAYSYYVQQASDLFVVTGIR
jgi:serine/threonine protein kinase